MKKFGIGQFVGILLSFTVVFGIAAVFFAWKTDVPEDIRIEKGRVFDYNEGWFYEKGEKSIPLHNLPAAVDTGELHSLVISKTISENLKKDIVLCLITRDQALRAYIGGEMIYEQRQTGRQGQYYGNLWNLIEIPKEYGGKQVRLEIAGNSGNIQIDAVRVGTKSAVILQIIKENAGKILFMCMMAFCTLFFLFCAGIFHRRKIEIGGRSFLVFGLFTILAGTWVLTDSMLLQFVSASKAVVYILSYVCFMLMSPVFLIYVRTCCKSRLKRLIDALTILQLLEFSAAMSLHIAGVWNVSQSLFLTHILLVVSVIVIITIACVEKIKYGNEQMRRLIYGFTVLSIGAIANVILFYLPIGTDNTMFFRWGLFAFVLILAYDLFDRSTEVLLTQMEAKTYKKIAYLDMMTGLYNRTAFEEDMENWYDRCKLHKWVGIVVFDVNNLKQTNDNFGHKSGDNLLLNSVSDIRHVFERIGKIYRIGGDEFVVILLDRTEAELETMMNTFRVWNDQENQNRQIPAWLAWGAAAERVDAVKANNLFNVFNLADSRMYACKHQQKKVSVMSTLDEAN